MIDIKVESDRVILLSDYHPELPDAAKQLGGKFNPVDKSWVFHPRTEQRVRDMAMEIYGSDGRATPETVSVKARYTNKVQHYCELYSLSEYVCGQQVARAYGRDSGASVSNNVVVLSGGFDSGGSMKNPALKIYKDTEIEIHDVPKTLVKNQEDWEVEIIKENGVDREKLLEERNQLVARVIEIDNLLNDMEEESDV